MFALCVLFMVVPAGAETIAGPGELTAAPVSGAFTEWQNRAATFAIQTYDEEGHALGLIPSPFDRSHLEGKAAATAQAESEPPSSYDLRSLGAVTSVKNQGSCGSCWTFATYGSLESWLLRNEGQAWDFSENHLKNYHGFDWGPCEGGNADMSTAYLARWSGPVLEADDPYHDYDDRPSPGGAVHKYLGNALWFFTDTDIKNAVMNYGGLYVSMFWESASYNSSAFTYYYSGNSNPNHGVTLAGWDDNKVVAGAPGNGAWLIKNSWGPSWGDAGYFWMSYYDSKAVVYAVAYCESVPTSLYANNYQYDPLGWINAVGFGSSTAWGANIFTAVADENLDAVGMYAVDDNVSVQVYIYDDFSGSSFSNLLASTSGTLVNSGYHTILLPSPVELTEGDDFAIVVKFTTVGYVYPVAIEEEYPDYASGATANPGESYVSSSGTTFTDITTYSGFETANVCIKGLTTPPAATPPTITSTPVTTATTGELYSYDVDASGWPPPAYALTTYPAGMAIDPVSGLIQWTPAATGDFQVEVTASNGELPDANQAFTITVSEPPPYVDDVANADIAIQGNVSGIYADTHSADNVYESITEVREGNPARGYSSLEHKWTVDVTGGNTVTFYVEAYKTVSSDGDNFTFAYSTDDSSYTDMLTVTKTSDDDNAQSCELPPSLAGTICIRVVDTDSGTGNLNMDTIYVDHLYIRSTNETPITHTLTISTVGSGSITADPDQALYTHGQEVILTANADAGWTFDSWSGDLAGSINPNTLVMDANKSVTATFAQEEYTLTVNTIGSGTVTTNPNQTTYHYGDVVELTATADPGWAFDSWSGDLTGGDNPDTVVIDSNTVVTATFTQDEYTLTVNTIGNGSVILSPDQTTYHYGDIVELTAIADAGWTFDSWSGGLAGGSNPDTIVMDANTVVTATFTQDEYTLTVNTIGSGTVTLNPDQATYHYGDTVELTATADTGWTFDSWAGELTGSANPDTMVMDANAAVTATFAQDEYTLTVNTVGNGQVTLNPDQATYHYGDTVELTASAEPGWAFDSWSGDLTGGDNPDTVVIDSNTVVTATFTQDEYTLTVNTIGNGTVTLNPDQATYHYGDTVELTATADTGWTFESWSGDLTGSENPETIAIDANKTVTATFEVMPFAISTTSDANGSIWPVNPTVNYGDSQVFTATPNEGYAVDCWYVDGNSVQLWGAEYTLENIQDDHAIHVTFGRLNYVICGYILEPDANTAIADVNVSASGAAGDVSDVNGYYEIVVEHGWSGTIEPIKEGWIFEPNSDDFVNVTSDINDVNYAGSMLGFTISGRVTEADYVIAVNDVNVSADGRGGYFTAKYGGGSDITDVNGIYQVVVDYNWSGTVRPTKYAWSFDPNNGREYVDVLADQNDQDYIGTLLTYSISGRIFDPNNRPIPDVLVDANNGGGADLTDANGFYELWVDYDWSGTVTPEKQGFYFDPNQDAYMNVLADHNDMNFLGIRTEDINMDGYINAADLWYLAEYWLQNGPPAADIVQDGFIDLLDFAQMGSVWHIDEP